MSETTAKGRDLMRGERLQVMLDSDELSALDDFRFNSRMPSRAAAVRELLRRGLAGEGVAVGRSAAKSGAYGVLDSPANGGGHSADMNGSQAPSK